MVVNDWLLAFGPVAGAVVAVARYRRLAEADRRRMAWPLLAVLVLVLGTVLGALADASALPRALGEGFSIASQLVLPVAMGIGIAAPGLFDALGTARRTLSYLALSALVLAVYVAVAGALGATVGGGDLYLAVVAAVVAALVLDPVRRTLVRRAERIAFGQEVSRDELLLRLGDTLERTLDRRALTVSIAETAMEGLGAAMGAARGGRRRTRSRRACPAPTTSSPRCPPGCCTATTTSARSPAARRPRVGPAPGHASSWKRWPARSRWRSPTPGWPMSSSTQLLEVDASRRRLVRAEENARRRLERDLHDGAQQDIAALLTRIALARNQLGRADLDRLDQTLTALHDDAGQALRNLRELVSGIHETALADQGLVAAVEGRAAKLPIPVEVTCGPGVRRARLPATLESTAYFTVCEALANTLKHGEAGHATIALDARPRGRLRIQVTDDGRGFEPAQRQRVQRTRRVARPDRGRRRHPRRAVRAGRGYDTDGRRAGGTMTTPSPMRIVVADDRRNSRRAAARTGASPADIREWALGQGITVSPRGRVAADVIAQYEAANA